LEVRGKPVLGENCPAEVLLLFSHKLKNSLVLFGVQPIAVLLLAEIQFEIVKPVLKAPHELAALRAFANCGLRAKHQAALLVIPEIENLVLELREFLASEPHSLTGGTDFHLDTIARLLHQFGIAGWAFHDVHHRLIFVDTK
jgi:hypothetical protein